MYRRLHKFYNVLFKFRTFVSEELLALFLVIFVLSAPVGATTRFENRSLLMTSVQPSVTTSYKVSLDYMTPGQVGSLDMQFCNSPIPYDPCVKPDGLDITHALLSAQSGEVGFSLQILSDTHFILSRAPSLIAGPGSKSSYTFDNIVNPSNSTTSFSIRMKSHASNNATGPLIDFGSVKGQVGDGINIETQVPPMLIFCAAQTVEENCVSTNGNFFTDMGDLSKNNTLTAQSQFAVGTNATAGFAVTVTGDPLAAGTNVIDGITSAEESRAGRNQFGINLVHNSELGIGRNPEGDWINATPTPDYNQPNRYKYVSGDVIASSPNVSLMQKFTVSYIVNVSSSLKAGVYTTTINYIASGRF